MNVKISLNLYSYSSAQLRQMYLTGVITKAEMNDELDDRAPGYDERIVTAADRKAVAA